MMIKSFILSIDQGTTGTKVLLLDRQAQVVGQGFQEHTQHYPQPGWVEHDPTELWMKLKMATIEALSEAQAVPQDIAAVGLANQGETVTAWSATTGKPLCPAIVWSCRRSVEQASAWEQDGSWAEKVMAITGLRIDAYFSATKFQWLLQQVKSVDQARHDHSLRLGTLDSWLLFCLTGCGTHLTDPSTAVRTLLYNLHTQDWDPELLAYLDIPRFALAEIRPTLGDFGYTDPDAFLGIYAPILVSQVDQPASLYGHLCFQPGDAKCTYGTGCFLYVNTGEQRVNTHADILSTIVWQKAKTPVYALESGVYSAGSAIKWLLELGLVEHVADCSTLASSLLDTTVKFIPALTGLAAPYWDSSARGAFLGLTAQASRADLVRAVLEGVAHRVADLIEAIEPHLPRPLARLKVDGGMTNNSFLMQFQADIIGIPIEVAHSPHITALGIAYLVGEGLQWWDPTTLEQSDRILQIYHPQQSQSWRKTQRQDWLRAVSAIRHYGSYAD